MGTPTPYRAVKFAAWVAFQTGATGKLARLNNVLVRMEHTAGGDASAKSTLMEWKARQRRPPPTSGRVEAERDNRVSK